MNKISIQITCLLFLGLFFLTTGYAEDEELSESTNVAKTHGDTGVAEFIQTPYSDEQNVLFELFLDEPAKINSALFWLRSYMNTLMEEPYAMAPEFINVIVLVHGTEIVTLAKKNYQKYHGAVERMRYYEQLGVEFRVCGAAAHDYGYTADDFYSFVKIVPSAMTELAHWQSQGYPLIRPLVFEKKYSIEEIR